MNYKEFTLALVQELLLCVFLLSLVASFGRLSFRVEFFWFSIEIGQVKESLKESCNP